jgi:hypothetical protein
MHPLAPTEPWEGGPRPGEDFPTDPAQKAAQLERLFAALADHPSKPAYYAWEATGRSSAIWVANARELRALLLFEGLGEEFQAEAMWAGPEQVRLWAMLDQRLLNLTAAAQSLIEKTTKLSTHYPGSDFALEYTRRLSAVRTTGIVTLVDRLRNFLLHDGGFAPIRANSKFPFSGTGKPVETSLYLDTARLLEERSWFRGEAREYLRTHPDIPLLDLIDEHERVVGGLYGWAFAQHGALEGANLDEVEDIQRRIRLTQTEGRNVAEEARIAFAAGDAARAAEAAERARG